MKNFFVLKRQFDQVDESQCVCVCVCEYGQSYTFKQELEQDQEGRNNVLESDYRLLLQDHFCARNNKLWAITVLLK